MRYNFDTGDYIQILTDSIIPCEENKVKVFFDNSSRNKIKKIKVDGGLIKDNLAQKCDYLVICHNNTHRFIELKGSNLNKAINQIISTNRILIEELEGQAKIGYIIFSKCPISSSDLQIKIKDFFRLNKFPLEFHSSGKTLPL